MYRTFQQASSLVDYFESITSRIEDQVLAVLFLHRILLFVPNVIFSYLYDAGENVLRSGSETC